MHRYKGSIFDLDGVLVNTACYHYQSWRRLARELGFDLTPEQNEALKGIPRMESLEIILKLGGVSADDAAKAAYAEKKNEWYKSCLSLLNKDSILPGALDFVSGIKRLGIKTAIGSASKNSMLIIDRLEISQLFDAIVDGTKVTLPKPNPETFLTAAAELGLNPDDCVVFEDAAAGVSAAKACGMYAVGIGSPVHLCEADMIISGLDSMQPSLLF